MRKRMKSSLGILSLLALVASPLPAVLPAGAAETPGASQAEADAGAHLWTQNCGRCHNKRSPERYSDAQWDVVVHHMRVRANLSGSDARAIVDFLKSAN